MFSPKVLLVVAGLVGLGAALPYYGYNFNTYQSQYPYQYNFPYNSFVANWHSYPYSQHQTYDQYNRYQGVYSAFPFLSQYNSVYPHSWDQRVSNFYPYQYQGQYYQFPHKYQDQYYQYPHKYQDRYYQFPQQYQSQYYQFPQQYQSQYYQFPQQYQGYNDQFFSKYQAPYYHNQVSQYQDKDQIYRLGQIETVPLRSEISPLRPEMSPLRSDIIPLRSEISPLRSDIIPLRSVTGVPVPVARTLTPVTKSLIDQMAY